MSKIFGIHSKGPQISGTAYTPVITGLGTVTNSSFFWKRDGDNMLVTGSFTAGTTTGVLASISLPNVTIDSSKISINNNTSASGQEVGGYTTANVAQYGPIVTAPATSTALVYFGNNPSGGAGTKLIPQIQPTSGSQVHTISFKVPITGWSANDILRTSDDTKI